MFNTVPDIMTLKECQALLKVGKNTLLGLIHDGEINAFKVGNRWKITKDSITAYVNKKEKMSKKQGRSNLMKDEIEFNVKLTSSKKK